MLKRNIRSQLLILLNDNSMNLYLVDCCFCLLGNGRHNHNSLDCYLSYGSLC